MIEKSDQPLISVVVTTLDRYVECRRCLESIREQDYSNTETIVVEDGSNSGIESLLSQGMIGNARYLRHDQKCGLAKARNTGIKAAKGKYIAFIDDDDVWKPNRLSAQISFWQINNAAMSEDVAMLYCGAEIHNASGRVLSQTAPRNRGRLKESIIEKGMGTIPSTYLFRRDAFDKIGLFDENLKSSIDHDLWMSIAVAGLSVDFVPEPLVVTFDRTGRDTMMSRTAERIQGVSGFVEKWGPVWDEWYGGEAKRYAENYFSTVIGSLAADNVARGRYGEALIACRAVLQRSSRPLRTSLGMAARMSRGAVRGSLSGVADRVRLPGIR